MDEKIEASRLAFFRHNLRREGTCITTSFKDLDKIQ